MLYNNRLMELREANNLKQSDIAKILNVDRSVYGKYEREYVLIPINYLNMLCNHFNISFDYIFSFTDKLNYENNSVKINKTLSGKRLKEFRKENKLTQDKLAKVLNISYGTLSGYEIGRYLIATPFLYTICHKYHISADYLLGKIDEPKYLK